MTATTNIPGGARAYPKTEVCAFRFTRAEWGLFSNFAPLPVPIAAGDWLFPTSEHLYQAAKFPARPDLQALIAAQPTPALAASIGRTAAPLTPTWHTDRVAVMRWAIRRKRETAPHRFDDLFRRTADRPIVEHSARDTYWGARRQRDALRRRQRARAPVDGTAPSRRRRSSAPCLRSLLRPRSPRGSRPVNPRRRYLIRGRAVRAGRVGFEKGEGE